MTEVIEKFSTMMIKARKDKGISRNKLAEMTGINYRSLQYMEKNEVRTPTLANAVKIASVLDIDLNKLKGGEKDE